MTPSSSLVRIAGFQSANTSSNLVGVVNKEVVMFKKIYYYLCGKYYDWTNLRYQQFPGHRILKDIQWILQKVFKGYNDCDLWDLEYHLAKLILKRLKAYKQMERSGYPPPDDPKCTEIKNEDDWEKVLDDMIEGFKAYIVERDCVYEFNIEKYDQSQQKINRGLNLFVKYFGYLWD